MSRAFSLFFAVAATSVSCICCGQIVRDGSVGSSGPGPVSGPRYLVNPSDGLQSGANLLHSFSQFNLTSDESVSFRGFGPAGDQGVSRFIVRVTGGSASNIDGLISSPVRGASVFLLNPSGIIFGPHVKLNLYGSFAATTADYIKLADGTRINAAIDSPVLTSAAPEAFGFLSANAAGILASPGSTVVPKLAVRDERVISLVAGAISIEHGPIRANKGKVNLVSISGPAEARFDPSDIASEVQVTGDSNAAGDIRIENGASLRSINGGRVQIRGGALVLRRAEIVGDTDQSNVRAGNVDIDVARHVELDQSRISLGTQGSAESGSVNIKANTVRIRSFFSPTLATAISTETRGFGKAGDVSISASDSITFYDHGNITTSTTSAGTGGNITLQATKRILMDGVGGSSPPTGTSADTLDLSNGAGDAGDTRITAGRLDIFNGAKISSRTKGAGSSGIIRVNVGVLRIDGQDAPSVPGLDPFTGIEARVGDADIVGNDGLGAIGDGGRVVIDARDMQLLRGGVVSASTFGRGAAGGIIVRCDDLTLRGSPGSAFTGLLARTTFPNGGGRGGGIDVNCDALTISGPASISASSEQSSGSAGGIRILARGPIELRDGGSIRVAADNTTGGLITLQTDSNLVLTNQSQIDASAELQGGNIDISASKSVALNNGSSITGLTRSGDGGRINISNADVVALAASVIDGQAGLDDVKVVIDGLLLQSTDSQILSDNAQFSLDTNLAQSLAPFDAILAGASARLQDSCAGRISQISSFTLEGHGGLIPDPAAAAPILTTPSR